MAGPGLSLSMGGLLSALASQLRRNDSPQPDDELRVFGGNVLACFFCQEKTLWREDRTGLRLGLGISSVRDSDAAGMDVGSEPGRIDSCVHRGRHAPPTRIDVAAFLVRIWIAVGACGACESGAVRAAAVSAGVSRVSAVAIRRGVSRALRQGRTAIHSGGAALDRS